MLERAFAEACATQGIVPGTADYAHYMVGRPSDARQPAVDVFRALFPGNTGRAEAAALSFERSFRAAVEPARAAAGARRAGGDRASCVTSGVRVCMITGLSRRLLGMVLDTLGWWRLVDLALSPEDVPRGCPWPDLMLAAMLRLGVEDVREAAYAGSTASGILCGRCAGARIVAGVLTGGHTRDRLRTAGATHFITGIGDFPALLADTSAAAPDVAVPGARMPEDAGPAGAEGTAAHGLGERGLSPLVPPQAGAPRIAPPPGTLGAQRAGL